MASRNAPRTVLLVGLPRSGTTWVADILTAPGASRWSLVNEPDNEKISLLGWWCKRDVPRFPLLSPGDHEPRFARLWEVAAGSPRAAWLARGSVARAWRARERFVARKDRAAAERARRDSGPMLDASLASHAPHPTPDAAPRLIKSVHCVLCVEWVCSVIPVDHVIVVTRHPLAILASWRRMNMPDATRPFTLSEAVQQRVLGHIVPAATLLERQALHLAVLWRGLMRQVEHHPEWVVVRHEDLCGDPRARFRALFDAVGLPFTAAAEAAIASRDRAGSGYKPVRRAADEVGKWRRDFTDGELAQATHILEAAGVRLPQG